MIGTIFWLVVVILIAKKIGEGLGGAAIGMNERSFMREIKKLEEKYTGNSYQAVWPHNVSRETYTRYVNESNEIRRRYGKPYLTVPNEYFDRKEKIGY